MGSVMPEAPGLLPYWLLVVSVLSVGNTVQCFSTLRFVRRVYAGLHSAQVTPLSSRTFGTWTLLAGLVRLYAAYNIRNPEFYQLAIWTFVLALAHHGSEWLVFRTAKTGEGLWPSLVVANVSLLWMLSQWSFYVQ